MKSLSRERGFSLLEVMVTAGLMGGIALFAAGLMRMGLSGSKALMATDDARTVTNDMATVLIDSTACTNTMAGRIPSASGGFSLTQVRDRSNSIRYQTGTADRYGPSRMQLLSITVGGNRHRSPHGLTEFHLHGLWARAGFG